MISEKQKFWVISADMGYGHQRVAHTFKRYAEGGVITIGSDNSTSDQEKKKWGKSLFWYEFFSRSYSFPFIGKAIFSIMDQLLKIKPLHPFRDLSKPTIQNRILYKYIKEGACDGVLKKVQKKKLPIVTTFYAPAIAADLKNFENIFCIICDIDINRVWAPISPKKSNINYFASSEKSVQRLKMYGINSKNIYLTGLPLPDELVGGINHSIIKNDMPERLKILNPLNKYNLGEFSEEFKMNFNSEINENRILTITYVVGGAGVLKEIGKKIAFSLKQKLQDGEVKLNLVAGTKHFVKEYFDNVAEKINSDNLQIIFSENLDEYFDLFNSILRKTDILWTKPGELTSYCALGIPIIIADPIGSQEEFNKTWLLDVEAGIEQEDPNKTHEWLFDKLIDGVFAKMAISGYLNTRQNGLYDALNIIESKNNSYSFFTRNEDLKGVSNQNNNLFAIESSR